MFGWLFGAVLLAAFAVVRHADCLAIKLGQPYGTLILTLSVIGMEVMMVSAVMLTGGTDATLARDTMFSVLMIVLNGLFGLSPGGWWLAARRAAIQPPGRGVVPGHDRLVISPTKKSSRRCRRC